MVKAIRGAVGFDVDGRDEIINGVGGMIDEIVELNHIDRRRIVSILFSITKDLRSVNPAAALRARKGWETVPLFCMQEPDTEGAMPMVVRALVTVDGMSDDSETVHVYRGGAQKLRPDLS